jgi:hypothetical protein
MSAADSVDDFAWLPETGDLQKVYLLGGKENLRWYYTSYWIKAIDYYAKSLSERVLPSFNDIPEEVARVEEETYNRLARLIDPADIGDQVGHAMGDFLNMAEGIVQGIIHLFTAGLYHLFVQQLIQLYRDQFDAPPPRSGQEFSTIKERLLQDCKIDISTFSSWDKLRELRLVANVVKHADGPSCTELRQARPDFFSHSYPVYQPLAGEDLHISVDEFTRYVEATKQFWEELAEAVD